MTQKSLGRSHSKLDDQAVEKVLCLCGNPAFVLVYTFNHQHVVTGVTTLRKSGLPLFVSKLDDLDPSADLKQPLFLSEL